MLQKVPLRQIYIKKTLKLSQICLKVSSNLLLAWSPIVSQCAMFDSSVNNQSPSPGAELVFAKYVQLCRTPAVNGPVAVQKN